MKKIDMTKLPETELATQFAAAAKERGKAVLDLNVRYANTLFDQMRSIDQELRARGQEARLALAPLLDDPDRFVRFYAAVYLIGLLPNRSRAVMEWNAKYGFDSLAADARGTLRELDAGTYKPD